MDAWNWTTLGSFNRSLVINNYGTFKKNDKWAQARGRSQSRTSRHQLRPAQVHATANVKDYESLQGAHSHFEALSVLLEGSSAMSFLSDEKTKVRAPRAAISTQPSVGRFKLGDQVASTLHETGSPLGSKIIKSVARTIAPQSNHGVFNPKEPAPQEDSWLWTQKVTFPFHLFSEMYLLVSVSRGSHGSASELTEIPKIGENGNMACPRLSLNMPCCFQWVWVFQRVWMEIWDSLFCHYLSTNFTSLAPFPTFELII